MQRSLSALRSRPNNAHLKGVRSDMPGARPGHHRMSLGGDPDEHAPYFQQCSVHAVSGSAAIHTGASPRSLLMYNTGSSARRSRSSPGSQRRPPEAGIPVDGRSTERRVTPSAKSTCGRTFDTSKGRPGLNPGSGDPMEKQNDTIAALDKLAHAFF